MTNRLPLFSVAQIRALEQVAIDDLGIPASQLMDRAGLASFKVLKQAFPTAKKIVVFCGSGNNAGDGYVLARLAHESGLNVRIYQYKDMDDLPPTAKEAARSAISTGVPCLSLDEADSGDADLIVDALLGIGLNATVSEPLASTINHINASHLPVLSLDLPSGLNADTGQRMGSCVQATTTITFLARKLGMMTADGPDSCGNILCHDLDLGKLVSRMTAAAQVLASDLSLKMLPKRPKNCHKKDFGHVLVIGGTDGMPGSVLLTAQAALRVGAGLVTIATRPQYALAAPAGLHEAMIYGIEEPASLVELLDRATVCVIGPGLGEDEWARALFKKAIASQLPMIIDASALRILSEKPQQDDNWVLTPHPGEAAALLACSLDGISEDRFQAVALLQARYGGQVVLKGVGSLIRTDEPATYLCSAGNAGMATAGMGDVLSGVIAGLAAQHLSLKEAALLGVNLHAMAADMAAEEGGERGMIATDLMPYLRRLVNVSLV